MPHSPTDKPPIEKTLRDQHRMTMNVVNAIKSDTETLMRKTDSIVEHLVEEGTLGRHSEPARSPPRDLRTQPASREYQERQTREPRDGRADPVASRLQSLDGESLVSEIARLCVNEVMQTINPILEALNSFIKANAIEVSRPPEPEDDLFAEKLIEQMKLAVGRRQKIAMARMKRSAP